MYHEKFQLPTTIFKILSTEFLCKNNGCNIDTHCTSKPLTHKINLLTYEKSCTFTKILS